MMSLCNEPLTEEMQNKVMLFSPVETPTRQTEMIAFWCWNGWQKGEGSSCHRNYLPQDPKIVVSLHGLNHTCFHEKNTGDAVPWCFWTVSLPAQTDMKWLNYFLLTAMPLHAGACLVTHGFHTPVSRAITSCVQLALNLKDSRWAKYPGAQFLLQMPHHF